ncbi:MAG TPA: acyl-ACP--UDP-N-acetylglucosamine O-acyltransferase [Stellaceae bacterium]|nr:acyl-ACP--UDP-N-acetylglucosamine O-acyltransferase [Stellaceae bacterium]
MPVIHPSAVVEPGARVAASARIGPFCHVGGEVELGEGVELVSHVAVAGRTVIGEATHIFPFASIGHQPQDLKYRGEPSRLVIGKGNIIREHVTMNPGTEGGGMVTEVGDSCLFMVGVHVAHDCRIGNHVIMANNATLAGHVAIGDHAVFGGLSAVHQFVRIGRHAMVGGVTGVERDVIPYGSVMGDRARLSGLNIIGMQRRGFSREEIQALRTAYQILFQADAEGTFAERLDIVAQRFGAVRPVREVLDFIAIDSPRGLTQPKPNGG